MKRVAQLVSFSHDHHHALSQARRLARASEGDGATRRAAAADFLAFANAELLLHMADEERELFPVCTAHGSWELAAHVARALTDHATLRTQLVALAQSLGDEAPPDPDRLAIVGNGLAEHVRFEERVLFPLVQAEVPLETLDVAVGDRTAAR